MIYRVLRDDRGRWGFSPDGVTFDPGSGAYRTPHEALDVLRATLRGRGLEPGEVLAWGDGLSVEAVPLPERIGKPQ